MGETFPHVTLRRRLYLASTLLFLTTLLGGGTLVVLQARRAVVAETDSSLKLASQLLGDWKSGVRRPSAGPPSRARLQLIERLAAARHLRALSEGEGKIDAPDWFVWLVRPEVKPIPVGGGTELVTDPGDEIEEAWQETRLFLGFLILLAGGSVSLLFWTVARFLGALDPLLEALGSVQRGDYSVRLAPTSVPELDRIVQSFNRMAEGLSRANRENHRLLQRLLQVQEEERRRIAHDLHDDLGQTLSGLKMAAHGLARAGSPELNMLVKLADRALRSLRDLLKQLQPAELESLGLEAALRSLVERWRQIVPGLEIETHFGLEGLERPGETARQGRLDGEREIHLYRIAQEALANAIRHAGASKIELFLEVGEGWIRLRVTDDGCGFDPERTPKGIGLTSLAERVAFLGGRLKISSAGPSGRRGTQLEVVLPRCGSSSSTTTPSSATAS